MALRADVADILASADSMRGMLQGCVGALVRHLDAAFARIWILRPGESELELRASAGLYTNLDGRHARMPVGAWKVGHIASDRTPDLTNDVVTDPLVTDRAWARREGIVAFAGHPLVADGRVVGVVAMFARRPLPDLTVEALRSISPAIAQAVERTRAEEALRRSEAYLAEGQRLSQTGSWARRLGSGERYWSAEMFRIFGFEPAERPPPAAEISARLHPEDVERDRCALREALATGTELRLCTRLTIPGQPTKWVETYAHPVRDDEGRLVEFIGTVVDVTERRRVARRLRQALKARYEAVIEERGRIARDMHDGLLQDLTGIAMQLAATIPRVTSDPGAAAARLQAIVDLVQRTGKEARRAVGELRPPTEGGDLVARVQQAARRAAAQGSMPLTVTVSGQARPLEAAWCDAASAIVHEAVINVARHAAASIVELRIAFGRRSVRIAVRDDGRGLPAGRDDGQPRYGLAGMRERASSVGANLRVTSQPGKGTTVEVVLPYRVNPGSSPHHARRA